MSSLSSSVWRLMNTGKPASRAALSTSLCDSCGDLRSVRQPVFYADLHIIYQERHAPGVTSLFESARDAQLEYLFTALSFPVRKYIFNDPLVRSAT